MPLHSLPLTYSDLTEEQWTKFWSRVGPHEDWGCRYWIDEWGNPSPRQQYGMFAANGRQYQMHRLAYVAVMLPRGASIGGDGLIVRHLCGDKRCCAGWHLEIGTHRENAQDFARHRPSYAPSSIPTSEIPKIDPVSDQALLYYIGDTRHPVLLTYDVKRRKGMLLMPSHVEGVWIDLPRDAAETIVEAAQRRSADKSLYVPIRSRHRLTKAVDDLDEIASDRIAKAISRVAEQAYLTPDSEIPAHIEIHPIDALVPTSLSRRTFVLRGSDAEEWWLSQRSTPLLRRMPTPENEFEKAVRVVPDEFVGWCEQHIKQTCEKADVLPLRRCLVSHGQIFCTIDGTNCVAWVRG